MNVPLPLLKLVFPGDHSEVNCQSNQLCHCFRINVYWNRSQTFAKVF